MTCLSSKQNVYGLLFDNSNERLEEDKLQYICSDKYDMLSRVDQESSDAECDNLEMRVWNICSRACKILAGMSERFICHTQLLVLL